MRLLAHAAVTGCALGLLLLATAAATSPRRGQFTILHTNDWHGHALPAPARDGSPAMGGVVAVHAAFQRVKAQVGAENVLTLDAGDLLTGAPGVELLENGVLGATFMRAWSAVGYDAWTVGNHDFDAGVENLLGLLALAKPPCLVANLERVQDGKPFLPVASTQTFQRGGLRVGVMGLTTADLARLTNAKTRAAMRARPLLDAARPLAQALRERCDVVVAVSHGGVDADRALARELPLLDVIVGGHSHTRMTSPVVEGRTLVVQAGAHAREYGRLDLVVEGGKVVRHNWALLPAVADGAVAPPEMAEPLARIQAHVEGMRKEVLGETTHPLGSGDYHGESPVGSFVADAVRDATRAEVGVMNAGGIRSDLPAGKVSLAHVVNMLPADDQLVVMRLTGSQLVAVCRHNAQSAVTRDHGALQFSGLQYRWRLTGVDGKTSVAVGEVVVAGKPVDLGKTYAVGTTRFIATEQPVKYLGMTPATVEPTGASVRGAVVSSLRKGPVSPPPPGRVVQEPAPGPR
jgi:5'-nucleotidase